MSAISALKGYRSQFLYSLYYILLHKQQDYVFRLEGEEDLDILSPDGRLLYAIQVKHFSKPLNLSDLLQHDKTSFLRRYLGNYPTSTPVVVSFGPLGEDLIRLTKNSNLAVAAKYKLTVAEWEKILGTLVLEQVNHDTVICSILEELRRMTMVDAELTAENMLYWLQVVAEKQKLITAREVMQKVEDMAAYLSARIQVAQQYGVMLKPLHRLNLSKLSHDDLSREFYSGVSARYEHVLSELDIIRPGYLDEIKECLSKANICVIHGASGQGKSTLAYRYVYGAAAGSMIFELNLPDDAVQTRQGILSITQITANLQIPVYFIINVNTNSTDWLKIAREFAAYQSLYFIVCVREEDWFKARAEGIQFLHGEVNLQLREPEARAIFTGLQKRINRNFADFTEAWILAGRNPPLLEFVHFLTQGQSLEERMKQQAWQLGREEQQHRNPDAMELLRLTALADSYGAKLQVAKLSMFPGLPYLVDKLEHEFLLRRTADQKYLLGLHPLRSNILTNILLDGFVKTRKEYAIRCLLLLAEGDLLFFIVQLLYAEVFSPEEIINWLSEQKVVNWVLYGAVRGALMWAGLRRYVAENQHVFNQCYEQFGDPASIMLAMSFGDTDTLGAILTGDLFPPAFKEAVLEWQSRLTPLSTCYSYVKRLFADVKLPSMSPASAYDWEAYGSLLFWIKHCDVEVNLPTVPGQLMTDAAEVLPLPVLAKVMMGLKLYDSSLQGIKTRLDDCFIQRLQAAYKVPLLTVDNNVTAHFITDFFSGGNISSNEKIMQVIDLLRYAFPDREQYNVYGHGRHTSLLPQDHDPAKKTIPRKNLPLDEFTLLNATVRHLFEYTTRPADWNAWHAECNKWERNMDMRFKEFIRQVTAWASGKGYQPLISLLQNKLLDYSRTLMEPQSISDRYGIFFNPERKVDHRDQQPAILLKDRYKAFFNLRRDLVTHIENFFKQSGETMMVRLQNIADKKTEFDFHLERVSLVNLFDAIGETGDYHRLKGGLFDRYPENLLGLPVQGDMMKAAVLWKDFLAAGSGKRPGKDVPAKRLEQVRIDFDTRLSKSIKLANEGKLFRLEYRKDTATGHRPVVLVKGTNTNDCFQGIMAAYGAIKNCVGNPDYQSLKQLHLNLHYDKFYFVPVINGRTMNHYWFVLPIHLFRDYESFHTLSIIHKAPQSMPDDVAMSLQLGDWVTSYPETEQLFKVNGAFTELRLCVEHAADLVFFEENPPGAKGVEIIGYHTVDVSARIQKAFQFIQDKLTELMQKFPFDEDVFETNERERQYWNAFLAVNKDIWPEGKGAEINFTARIGLPGIRNWAERLQDCSENFAVVIFALLDKFIELYAGDQQ